MSASVSVSVRTLQLASSLPALNPPFDSDMLAALAFFCSANKRKATAQGSDYRKDSLSTEDKDWSARAFKRLQSSSPQLPSPSGSRQSISPKLESSCCQTLPTKLTDEMR